MIFNKLEKDLNKLKFKKKYLCDESGYWFEKNIKYKDFKLKIYCEPDQSILLLQVKSGEYCKNMVSNMEYYDIKKFKCNISEIKKLLKKYEK